MRSVARQLDLFLGLGREQLAVDREAAADAELRALAADARVAASGVSPPGGRGRAGRRKRRVRHAARAAADRGEPHAAGAACPRTGSCAGRGGRACSRSAGRARRRRVAAVDLHARTCREPGSPASGGRASSRERAGARGWRRRGPGSGRAGTRGAPPRSRGRSGRRRRTSRTGPRRGAPSARAAPAASPRAGRDRPRRRPRAGAQAARRMALGAEVGRGRVGATAAQRRDRREPRAQRIRAAARSARTARVPSPPWIARTSTSKRSSSRERGRQRRAPLGLDVDHVGTAAAAARTRSRLGAARRPARRLFRTPMRNETNLRNPGAGNGSDPGGGGT